MYAVIVTFRVNPKDSVHFLDLVRKNALASKQQEPGCLQFDVCSDAGAPGEVFLYELYSDADAFQAHLASEHFLSFDRAISNMVQVKTVRTYGEVFQ